MNGIASVFLAPLQGLLSTFQSERHYKDNKKDEALHAIHAALLETKKYIELSDGVEDREKEYQLAQLWAEASVKSRYASEELMMRLQDKSKYWSDTIEWSRDEILAKKIDFESIENQINELLGNS
ncbi:hypothetical protein [Candidatus Thiodiazotropha sp. LNASS1]|uniref:hypothetical protein n=1 Tax=Candidatus Thiodiazotropha sp. LNASS1 TaxID=3096260 RepID=UPI0034DF02F5